MTTSFGGVLEAERIELLQRDKDELVKMAAEQRADSAISLDTVASGPPSSPTEQNNCDYITASGLQADDEEEHLPAHKTICCALCR